MPDATFDTRNLLQRTAVVVVHGIGEQRPLDTLLGFAGVDGKTGLLSVGNDPAAVLNPDAISGATYLRRVTVNTARLTTRLQATQEQKEMARTVDFYEYYWAYRFRDTTWRHITQWLRDLLRISRSDITPSKIDGRTYASPLRGTETGSRRLLLVALVAALLLLLTDLSVLLRPELRRLVENSLPNAATAVVVLSGVALVLLGSAVLAMNPLGLISIAKVMLSFIIGSAVVAAVATMDVNAFTSRRHWLLPAGFVAIASALVCWRLIRVSRSATVRLAKYAVISLVVFSLIFVAAVGSLIWLLWGTFEPTGALLIAVVPTVIGIAAVIASSAALRSVGDAARYLSNSPDNIEEREKIRTGLVALLERLHQQLDPYTGLHTYDRVVVIGHSLGSVIAYDAVWAYWTTATRTMALPLRNPDALHPLSAMDSARLKVVQELEKTAAAGSIASPADWIAQKRTVQALLRYPDASPPTAEAKPSTRWIISDLVTVGSPLAHSEMLLAEGKDDLANRKKRRILAIDPPPKRGNKNVLPLRYTVNSFRPPLGRSSRMLSTAPFAAVAWTNLYFSHDMVGGPLRHAIGSGVRDIRLAESPPYLLNFLLRYPHSSYWPGDKDRPGTYEARDELRAIFLKPAPVVLIVGATADVVKLVDWLCSKDGTKLPPAGCLPTAGYELRLLAEDTCDGAICPSAWAWPGPSPYFDADAVRCISDAARDWGLRVYESGGTGSAETADAEIPEGDGWELAPPDLVGVHKGAEATTRAASRPRHPN